MGLKGKRKTKNNKAKKTNGSNNASIKKESTGRKVSNEANEEKLDPIEILIKKYNLTRDDVDAAEAKFFQERPNGEINKEEFLLEIEVENIWSGIL